MAGTIIKDALLFHPVHGLCRVSAITQSIRTEELSYILLPVINSKAKIRFVIPESALENSGFSKLISNEDGQAILKYLKTGKDEGPENSRAWKLARLIWTEAFSKEPVKDARRRQQVNRSVKGLASELAFVLKLTLKEIAAIIQRNLGRSSAINPVVLMALTAVDQE